MRSPRRSEDRKRYWGFPDDVDDERDGDDDEYECDDDEVRKPQPRMRRRRMLVVRST